MNSTYLIIATCVLITVNGTMGITDGIFANDGQFKYQVVILDRYHEHICSGGIIDESHILTSAHCVYGLSYGMLNIGAGAVDFRDNDIILKKVINVEIPEDYVDGHATADSGTHLHGEAENIAVVTIHPPFVFNDRVRKLILPFSNITACEVGIMAGWGESEPEEEYSPLLLWTYQRILEPDNCAELKTYHYADEFCTITPENFGQPSDGDDGAPLVVGLGIIIGVAGQIFAENGENLTRFTNVYYHRDFIMDKLGM